MNSCCGDRGLSSWPTAMLPPSLSRRLSFSTRASQPALFLCSSKSTVNSLSSSQSRSRGRPFYNPLGRLWIEADDRCPPPPPSSQERFTVVSYNILGDRNSFNHPDLYLDVPSSYLNWDYRRRLICEELIGYDSDIICLQEVDRYFDLLKVMQKAGYEGSYKSAIYKFLSSSKLNIKLHDRKNLSGQRNFHPTQVFGTKRETGSPLILMDRYLNNNWTAEEVTAATGHSNRDFIKHPLKLSSSYATVKGSERARGFNGEPLATSFHSKFVGTVDYIWHSNGVQTMGVLDTLPLDFLKRIGGLPCKTLGSDHLALVSEFAFTEATEKNITDTVQSTSSASPRFP